MIGWAELTQLQWREPLWLLLATQPLLFGLLQALRRQRQGRYAAPALRPWVVDADAGTGTPWRRAAAAASWMAWVLLAVAAAGPRVPLAVAGEAPMAPATLLVLLDASPSMQATDIRPQRLRRARIELDELRARAGRLRIGVMVYAGRPHLLVPPTADADALDFYLDQLETLVLPTAGSRHAVALEAAGAALAGTDHAALLWITDGDFGASGEPAEAAAEDGARLEAAASALAEAGVPLYILGVGTAEGAAVPTPEGGWLHVHDRPVISRLDAGRLQVLAARGGGAFSPVRADDGDWRRLYDAGIAARLPAPEAAQDDILWRELYRWALLPGFLLLLAPPLLRARMAGTAPLAAVLLLGLLLPLPSSPLQAAEAEQRAYQALTSGEYAAAAEFYGRVAGFRGLLGEGVGRYRQEDYETATARFGQAVLAAGSDAERALALHNLGNSQFRLGDYAGALASFRDALNYQPERVTTRHNLALSEVLLEAVEERLGEGLAERAGTGPVSRRAAEGLEVGENTTVSLADGENEAFVPDPVDPDALPEALILRGLERLRLTQPTQGVDRDRVRREQAVGIARLRMEALADDQPLLWKTLFELEEGFVSPLDEPARMQGVAPW
ncbi:MAG TPA: VWA domain-containing protein [Thioalkalivibrio sp.]|nr:VWA domain-containing protein [Thioalkalivibrio sp.]